MTTGSLIFDTLRFRGAPDAATLRERWAVADTGGLVELAALEGCDLWLYRRLKAIGALDATTPPDFAPRLGRNAKRVAGHNMRVDAQTEAVVGLLQRDAVPHTLLKGAALRALSDRFPLVDARPTHDVDLILPSTHAPPAWERLREAGYTPQPPPGLPPEHFHLCPLVDAAGVAVELHTSTSNTVTTDEAWRRAADGGAVTGRDGQQLRVPSATELLWHAACHALGHDARAFRLRFFLDVAAILAAGAAIDWPRLIARAHPPEIPFTTRLAAWLRTAAELGGAELPAPFDRSTGFDLVRALDWRLWVVKRWRPDGPVAERLLDEGTRGEVGMPLASAVAGSSAAQRIRRRSSTLAGRAAYYAWRLTYRG